MWSVGVPFLMPRGQPQHDEPSEDDVLKFADATKRCPNCNAEMYDDAEVCWKCGDTIGARTGQPKWIGVTAVVLVVAIVLAVILGVWR